MNSEKQMSAPRNHSLDKEHETYQIDRKAAFVSRLTMTRKKGDMTLFGWLILRSLNEV